MPIPNHLTRTSLKHAHIGITVTWNVTPCSSVRVHINIWKEPLTPTFSAGDLFQFQNETIGSAAVLTTTYKQTATPTFTTVRTSHAHNA